MMRYVLVMLALALMAVSVGQCATNVAQGKTVTLFGAMNGAAASVVDGSFLPEFTQWQTNTVWWNGTTPHIEIDLGGVFTITSMTVQADNNDTYIVKYLDASSNWATAWAVPTRSTGGGMTTRPGPTQTDVYNLPTAITTSKLWFSATGGDNMYSVSEIKAFGESAAVPEASSLALAVGCGLPSLAALRLRRRRA